MSDFVTATYDIASYGPLATAAEVLAGEQSSGTFTAVARETAALRAEYGAVAGSLREIDGTGIPPLPGARQGGPQPSYGRVSIRFPLHNFGTSLPNLLTAVAGNLFELRDLAAIRLVDLDLPEEFGIAYPGPRFGVEGTRKLLGRPDGVLIGTIIKPSVGLSIAELRAVVRELAEAGIDFIKDDELIANPPYAPLAQRVPAVLAEIDRVAQRTGKKTMYAFNITDDLDAMARHQELVANSGGTCVMVVVPMIGLSGVDFLRRRCDLPLHGHRAGFGGVTRSPSVGIDFVAYQKAARLAGVDHLHTGGLDSKFYESNESVTRGIRAVQTPLLGGYECLPVVSSGQWAGTAPVTYRAVGNTDMLVLAGGGIHGHPGGVRAGVESLREAWDATVHGIRLEDRATSSAALRQALEKFGSQDGTR